MSVRRIDAVAATAAETIAVSGRNPHASAETFLSEVTRRTDGKHAMLFARPVVGEAGGMDWYAPQPAKDIRAWPDLDPEERAALAERLHHHVDALTMAAERSGDDAYAAMVRAALSVPGEADILSADGRPLLVRWAMKDPDIRAAGDPFAGILAAYPRSDPEPDPEEGVFSGDGASRDQPIAPLRFFVMSALASVLLLSFSGFLLLQHCGVALPPFLTGGRTVVLFDFCHSAAQASDLPRIVDVLERRVADLAEDCPQVEPPQSASRSQAAEQPPATEQPSSSDEGSAEPPPVDSDSIEERRADKSLESGALTVTLAWNGKSDLDLNVICPSGQRIFFGNKQACDGKLQIDMNAGNRVAAPIEDVFWPEGKAPSGEYSLHVACFGPTDECSKGIPFTLQVHDRQGTDMKVFTGVARERAKPPLRPDGPTYVGSFSCP